jgi:hypothetical protein
MKKYRVHFETGASFSVEVEVPDGESPYDEQEAAIEAAYDKLPGGVCAQCAGWGQKYSLDLGEWEIEREQVPNEKDDEGKTLTWKTRDVEPELIED